MLSIVNIISQANDYIHDPKIVDEPNRPSDFIRDIDESAGDEMYGINPYVSRNPYNSEKRAATSHQ